MNEVVNNIFIGSYEDAINFNHLKEKNINLIISLGCKINFSKEFQSKSFPFLLDTPETIIIHLFEEINSLISDYLQRNENNQQSILIHCIYGQSRSATICIAYLISKGMNLEDSLRYLKSIHSNICINPGFLAQLYIYTNKGTCLIQYSLLIRQGLIESSQQQQQQQNLLFPLFSLDSESCQSNNNNIENSENSENENNIEQIKCKNCHYILAISNHLEDLLSNELKIQEFIKEFIDVFWSNYFSNYIKTSNLISLLLHDSNILILPPYNWIQTQINQSISPSSSSTSSLTSSTFSNTSQSTTNSKRKKRKRNEIFSRLSCPNCMSCIGSYQRKTQEGGGILLGGGYLVTDLFMLDRRCIRQIQLNKVRIDQENILESDQKKEEIVTKNDEIS